MVSAQPRETADGPRPTGQAKARPAGQAKVRPAGQATVRSAGRAKVRSAGRSTAHFRGDVAGLRAVAVVLVLLYHAGVGFLPGGFAGVDVFFVISGFLITGQLLAEVDRTGRISLLRFYARRTKRILPAAAVVLIVTAVVVWFAVPRIRWQDIGGDIVASATYVVNWRLADRAVDYFAQGTPASPVQHFWSLAVEEQFYVVWPLLILAAVAIARLGGHRIRTVLAIGLGAVGMASFVWSVVDTSIDPGRAFFVTTTRIWELAVGAGIALAATYCARLRRSHALVIGWIGLAAIVVSGFVVDTTTPWPGYAALLPTLGTAAVIVAGTTAGRRGPVAILGTRPFRQVGDLSYSLYLWHWPLIAIVAADGHLSVGIGLLLTAASVGPAWLTFRYVENPIRFSLGVAASPRLALGLGGNFTLAGISAGIALVISVALSVTTVGNAARLAPGAASLGRSPTLPSTVIPNQVPFITPDPLRAGADVPVTTADGCFQNFTSSTVLWCTYANTRSKTEVVLVGDSKMDEWFPAFYRLAKQNNWKLSIAVKGACAFTLANSQQGEPARPYPSCTAWNRTLLAKLLADRPTYVVTSQGGGYAYDSKGHSTVGAMVAGMRASWSALAAVGTKVIALANNPHPGLDIDQCVDQHRTRLSACAYSHDVRRTDSGYAAQRATAAIVPGVKMIDLFNSICPGTRCSPVIGDVLVYRQGSHLTATYVKSLTPQLATALSGAGLPARYGPAQ